MSLPLPNPVKRGHAFVCDLRPGIYVAHDHPTPEQGALIVEYERVYHDRFGHPPRGMHVIANPSDPEGLGVMFPPLVLDID